MKWFVCALVLFNLGLWFYTDYRAGLFDGRAVSEGRLPRVAELELLRTEGLRPSSVGGAEEETDKEASTTSVATDQGEVKEQEDKESTEKKDGVEKATGRAPDAGMAGAASPEPQSPIICVEIGWFDDEEEARSVPQSFPAIPVDAKVFQIEQPLTAYHWIILPPFSSRTAAQERFSELQRAGVDSYLVTRGPQENAISLGLFRSRAAAQTVLAQRQAQGLNARLASFPRNQIRYGLVFEVGREPGERLLEAAADGFDNRFESVSMGDCEGVATAPETP